MAHKKTIITVAAGILLLVHSPEFKLQISTAQAETIRATQQTRVMSRPGERSRVITRVSSGRKMVVLARRGRWIKVRVNGRTGWVTRTSVVRTRNARTARRRTRRRPFVQGRSKRRGWSGNAPKDRVGADAVDEETLSDDDFDDPPKRRRPKRRARRKKVKVRESRRVARRSFDEEEEALPRDEPKAEKKPVLPSVVVSVEESRLYRKPSSRSRRVLTVEQGDKLSMVKKSRSGRWMLVRDSDGESGWIRSDDVQAATYKYPKTLKRIGASIGYTSWASQFASDGTGEFSNYNISTAAAALNLRAEYLQNYSKDYLLGVEGNYNGLRASPGIRVTNAAGDVADIAFTRHAVNLTAKAGYKLNNKMGAVVFARAGYYYAMTEIHDGENLDVNIARLPSEVLQGITVGASVEAPQFSDKVGVRISIDALYPNGKLEQTSGLEDGAVSKVFAAWATGHVIYQWKPNMTLEGIYRYSYTKAEFEGAAMDSERLSGATQAARKDVGHTIMIGLGKKF